MDILDEIVARKRVEVAQFKEGLPLSTLQTRVEEQIMQGESPASMRKALLQSPTGIIAEFKRKSPSKGWIKEEGKANEIPLSYQQSGAAALSILTDEHFFGGSDRFVREARQSGVRIPILYKNFVIDEYQLWQARMCGASAVLLIAACLEKTACQCLLRLAHQLQLEVLLEMHAEQELAYAELEPDLYGINNRNLGTFVTDVQNSFRLAERLPKNVCKVSESGISHPDTIRQLRQAGFNGFLVGECFMKTANPGECLKQMIDALTAPAVGESSASATE